MDYIKITLESDLCVASGESSGNTVDSDICIDSYGFPYIPARRIKGCLREAAQELMLMEAPEADPDKIRDLFGNPYGKEGSFRLMNGYMDGIEQLRRHIQEIKHDKGKNEILRKAAHPVNIERLFSQVYGQTKMQDGVKVDNTLRFTRVLRQFDPLEEANSKVVFWLPVCLEDKKLEGLLSACCKAMRHIGLNRNRGRGDITAELCMDYERENPTDIHDNRMAELCSEIDNFQHTDSIKIFYTVLLEDPVTIPGFEECETAIPGRSVIGCMSGTYLKNHKPDETFQSLFLNGDVSWSHLTPLIEGNRAVPTPFMLMKLKNGGGRLINRFAQKTDNWKNQKPKTLDGSYAVVSDDGYVIADPVMQMFYHHSIQKSQLYVQNALEAGLVYGGYVEIASGNKSLAKEVIRLLLTSRLGFGRSKGAQYASCRLLDTQIQGWSGHNNVSIEEGKPVIVVLESDLILNEYGIHITQNSEVRRLIAKSLEEQVQDSIQWDEEKKPLCPQGLPDLCQYKTIGGYHTMWQLQKPHIPAIKAGSVYCFISNGGVYPRHFSLGEFVQEGFGKCTIYSLAEIENKKTVKVGTIDKDSAYDSHDKTKALETAMRVLMVKDILRRYAREYQVKDRNVPISRLRLMLSEAASYSDLCKRVGTMKKSDVSSVNEKGKRKITEELLRDFYKTTNENDSVEHPLYGILKTEEGLLEELQGDREALEEINKLWKLPLDLLLHNMHYTKGQ